MMNKFILSFFKPNPMEVFSTYQDIIFMEQVDMLSKEKEMFIMQLMDQIIWYDAYVYTLNFRAKSNGSIFYIQGYHLHGVGGHVEQGDGGFHHVVDGVVYLV